MDYTQANFLYGGPIPQLPLSAFQGMLPNYFLHHNFQLQQPQAVQPNMESTRGYSPCTDAPSSPSNCCASPKSSCEPKPKRFKIFRPWLDDTESEAKGRPEETMPAKPRQPTCSVTHPCDLDHHTPTGIRTTATENPLFTMATAPFQSQASTSPYYELSPESKALSQQQHHHHPCMSSMPAWNQHYQAAFRANDDETKAALEVAATNLGKSTSGYRCIYCGKFYSRKYGLKIHLRTHTGFKPLKCKVCSRAFSDPSNLNKHTRLHTEQLQQEQQQQPKSDHCSMPTGQPTHPYLPSSQPTPLFKCNMCLKFFGRQRDLNHHLSECPEPCHFAFQLSPQSFVTLPQQTIIPEDNDVDIAG